MIVSEMIVDEMNASLRIQHLRPSNQLTAPIKQPPIGEQNYTNPSLNSLHPTLNILRNDKKQHQNQHHSYPLQTVQVKKNRIQKANQHHLNPFLKEPCDPITQQNSP